MDSTSYTAYDNVWFSQSIIHSVSRMDTTTLLYTLMTSGSIYEKQNHTWPNYNNYIKSDASFWLGSLHLFTLGSISLVRRVENKDLSFFFVHTYLVQALSTARILFDTIHAMTLKEGILYKMAIIIIMTIAQISLMDSSAKKIYNSLELISEFPSSVAWMSLMLLET